MGSSLMAPSKQLADAQPRADAPVLNRERFDKFLELVASRLPIMKMVEWVDSPHVSRASETARSLLVDMTPDVAESDGTRGRRMFVQV